MIDKIKRRKKINRQDNTSVQSIEQLRQKYDLENADIYNYLDYLVVLLNEYNTGNIIREKDKIYLLANKEKKIAEKVIRIDKIGIWISESGINGEYEMLMRCV